MKNIPLTIFSIMIVFGCSKPAKNAQESESEKAPLVAESEPITDQAQFLTDPIVKEQLFFFIRYEVVNVDEYTFVKYEDLFIDGASFTYQAVIADQDLLHYYEAHNQSSELIHLASHSTNQYLSNDELGDTITVTGNIQVLDSRTEALQGTPASLKVRVVGEVESSHLMASVHSYGAYEREYDFYELDEEWSIEFNKVVSYSREDIYLKARIQPLTNEELQGFTSEELAYLRNELYARHGHTFKSVKMQKYFGGKDWYVPYFYDAAPFLNEVETQNALFIKSLEG